MRIFVIVLFTSILLFILIKPFFTRTKRSLIWPTILASLIMVTSFYEIHWLTGQNVGTQVVKEVSGDADGYLHCQRISEGFFDATTAKGFVYHANPKEALVKYNTCQDFFSWLDGDKKNATPNQIMAIQVLIHEAVHVGGDFNEASTECTAMSKFVEVTIKLGASEAEAQRMSTFYKENIYPTLSEKYRSNC